MRLLICTQAVDKNNPVLGFFHEWIALLATKFDSVVVICLYRGEVTLPENVRIHSLGKENAPNNFRRIRYAYRFIRLAWTERHRYDAVFIHMNEEYVLLAGMVWKVLKKRVYLWRNHYAGTLRTNVAVTLCTKVFYTSLHSYTARFAKAVRMPVGVDTRLFTSTVNVSVRKSASILFLSRMSPSKNPLLLLDAMRILNDQQIAYTATFAGSPLPEHEAYYADLLSLTHTYGLEARVTFLPAITHEQTPALYRSHDLFVNCSPSGMFDKTLFEAAASGCIVLAKSADFKKIAGEAYSFNDAKELACQLSKWIEGVYARDEAVETLRGMVEENRLSVLINRLSTELA